MKRKVTSLTGLRFGRLVVSRQAASLGGGKDRWYCHCDCGKDVVRYGYDLRRQRVHLHSCGCTWRGTSTIRRPRLTHEHPTVQTLMVLRRLITVLDDARTDAASLDAPYSNTLTATVSACEAALHPMLAAILAEIQDMRPEQGRAA